MNDNVQLLALAMNLVLSLIVLIMGFFMYRSIPQSAVQQLLDAAEKTAQRTASPVDDEAVKLARSLAMLLQVVNQPQPTTTPAEPTPEAQDVKKK